MTFKVSVIIPTWNRASLVTRAIESVLRQTASYWELIIIDDGSQDDTETICTRYVAEPQVRYYKIENQGVSAARNYGIGRARSEWLAFLDSDDEWKPSKLEEQFRMVTETEDKICHTDEIWIRRDRRVNQMKKHQKHSGWIFLQCLPLCAISPSSSLVHRSVFERVGMFNTSFVVCEDYEFWLRATRRFRVSLLDDALIIKYGGHSDQLSRKFWGMDRWRVKALHARLPEEDLPSVWKRAVLDEILHKTHILVDGYQNNGRFTEAKELQSFQNQMQQWSRLYQEDSVSAEPPPDLPSVINKLEN